jgi:uncharacterized protein YjiS (DUF1127 family)
MNASDTTITRRFPYHPAYALLEELVEWMVSGWRTLSRWSARFSARFAAARRSGQARRELHRLSDRSLRDIGLERDQIDRLFL